MGIRASYVIQVFQSKQKTSHALPLSNASPSSSGTHKRVSNSNGVLLNTLSQVAHCSLEAYLGCTLLCFGVKFFAALLCVFTSLVLQPRFLEMPGPDTDRRHAGVMWTDRKSEKAWALLGPVLEGRSSITLRTSG